MASSEVSGPSCWQSDFAEITVSVQMSVTAMTRAARSLTERYFWDIWTRLSAARSESSGRRGANSAEDAVILCPVQSNIELSISVDAIFVHM
jgi:hypothetical protein